MRKQTNLAEVKLTALALLSTEINETPYSPMIVKHPFTDTGVSAIPDGKCGVEMIDLTEDDAQLRWRQSMARQIDMAISGISQSSVTKMGKNENVNTEVLVRICLALNCVIGDIAEIILPESQQA